MRNSVRNALLGTAIAFATQPALAQNAQSTPDHAVIKSQYATACKTLDDARQFSNGSIQATGAPRHYETKLKTGACVELNSGSVKIAERSGRMSCINYNDTGPCLWISNNWFIYPIRWDIPVKNIGEGAACLTLQNAIKYRDFHADYDTKFPPEFIQAVDENTKYYSDIDCTVYGTGEQEARIVDQTVVSGIPMVCVQELRGHDYDLGPCYWTRPDIWERRH
jgi:hypothetical protein